jgi:hypothetical protein
MHLSTLSIWFLLTKVVSSTENRYLMQDNHIQILNI